MTGSKVRVAETMDAVIAAWPQRQTVQAVATVTRPTVSVVEIRRDSQEFAVPAMSAPVTFVANNIKIAAAALNDALIRPGGQFSLNAWLGKRTRAKGYQEASVICADRLISEYGGGVSQVSTATLDAAFFAGVRTDQYLAHSFSIARYPEGREAIMAHAPR